MQLSADDRIDMTIGRLLRQSEHMADRVAQQGEIIAAQRAKIESLEAAQSDMPGPVDQAPGGGAPEGDA